MDLKGLAEVLVFESVPTMDDCIVGHSLYARHSVMNQCFMPLRRVWNGSPHAGFAKHLMRKEETPLAILRSASVAAWFQLKGFIIIART